MRFHRKNLKKTSDMVDGQVGFHRPHNKKRVSVEKNNPIVNALNKTKIEKYPNLREEQQMRLDEIRRQEKEKRRQEIKEQKLEEMERKKEREERSYDRIMNEDNMTSNKGRATVDASAAEEYEDDFF